DECFGEGFGDVLRGNEVDLQADSLHCSGGGRAYDSDSLWGEHSVATLMEDFDGVGAGEEEPVEIFEPCQCRVEGRICFGRDDFDGGDEDGDRAESFELNGKVGSLTAGSGNQDAFVIEDWHLSAIVVWPIGSRRRLRRWRSPRQRLKEFQSVQGSALNLRPIRGEA